MAYVNWKNSGIRWSISSSGSPHGGSFESSLRVWISRAQLAAAEGQEWIQCLGEVLSTGKGELRLELPGQCTIFWKAREGESRLLLAHPESEMWVATVALTSEHGGELLARLSQWAATAVGSAAQEIELSRLGAVGGVSNVEIIFSLSEL